LLRAIGVYEQTGKEKGHVKTCSVSEETGKICSRFHAANSTGTGEVFAFGYRISPLISAEFF